MADVEHLKSLLAYYPDFPKKGVTFCDVFPLLRDPLAFEALMTHITHHLFSHTLPTLCPPAPSSAPSTTSSSLPATGTVAAAFGGRKIDVVVGLDARGFLFGPIVAQRLGAGFVPVRKQGKLPGECVQATYEKEYGQDIFEMQKDAIAPGSRVLIIDDLIATGGSAKAAGELVAKLGGKTVEYIFLVSIPFLQGTEKLDAPAYSIVEIDD